MAGGQAMLQMIARLQMIAMLHMIALLQLIAMLQMTALLNLRRKREIERAQMSHLICHIRGWDSCHESCAADGDAVHGVADSLLSSTVSSLPTFRAPVHEA